MTLSLLGREIVRHRSPICYSLNMRNPFKHKKTIPFWLLGITAAAYGAALGYLYARQVDILPALLSQRERPWAIGPLSNGDSYGVLQAIHLEESLRWVPASSEMHALPLRAWHG